MNSSVQRITPTYPPNNISSETNSTQSNHIEIHSHSLSKAEIAGIAIGSWATVAVCAIVLFVLYRRRKEAISTVHNPHGLENEHSWYPNQKEPLELHPEVKKPVELHDATLHELLEPPTELDGLESTLVVSSDVSNVTLVEHSI